jgi:hypothetical protein
MYSHFSVRSTYNRDLGGVCSQSHMLCDSQTGMRWTGPSRVNALVKSDPSSTSSTERVKMRHKGSKL